MTDFLEYAEDEHAYYKNGVAIPSVTQILKHAGLVSPYMMDAEAAWRGQQVHEITAKDDIERVDMRTITERFRPYLRAWRAFRRDTGFSVTEVEARVDSPDGGGYAGRCDRIGYLPQRPNGHIMLDIKTGVPPSYAHLQTAAYAHAHNPQLPWLRMVVALSNLGTYNVKTYPFKDYFTDRDRWLILVGEYHKAKMENKNERSDTDSSEEHGAGGIGSVDAAGGSHSA